jgi:hypothetical protein
MFRSFVEESIRGLKRNSLKLLFQIIRPFILFDVEKDVVGKIKTVCTMKPGSMLRETAILLYNTAQMN